MLIDFRKFGVQAKAFGARVSSVFSGIFAAITPRWTKAEETWKGWTLGKKEIAVGIFLIGGLVLWHWSIDVTRFVGHGYSSAREYVKGDSVTKAEMTAEIAKLPKAADLARLQSEIDTLKSDLASVDDKLDAKAAPLTTGSLPAKKPAKKSLAKKSSYSVPGLSNWLP